MVSETSGHAGKSVHRQLVARGSTRGPGITTEQSRREQTVAMPPGCHSRRGGPVVIPSIPYLLQGATQVQWTRRESTLQGRKTDCWRRLNLWLASTAINRILNTLFSVHFSPFLR